MNDLLEKSISLAYIIFNREHGGVTPAKICEFRCNRTIFVEVIVRMYGRTDGEINRQTEVINTFQVSLERVKNDYESFIDIL